MNILIHSDKMNLIFHSVPNAVRRFTIVIHYDKMLDNALCGLAICHPGDQFTKQLGRTIAQGRAVRNPFQTIPVDPTLTEQEAKRFLLNKGYELIDEIELNPEKFISQN